MRGQFCKPTIPVSVFRTAKVVNRELTMAIAEAEKAGKHSAHKGRVAVIMSVAAKPIEAKNKPRTAAEIYAQYKTLNGCARTSFYAANKDAIWSAFYAEQRKAKYAF